MMQDLYATLKSLWVVWFMALFVGIVIWAYWPKRKAEMEDHGQIPLRDDDDRKRN
jgi:cytochrome c oxidase cbb3-type subunit 4